MMGRTPPQPVGRFTPRSPYGGYYNDLRAFARAHFSSLPADPASINVVTMAQVGLGAWQLAVADPAWRPVVARVARRLTRQMDADGLLPYRFPMPHTFPLEPPWYSAMAQGQAASFLVRAGHMLGERDLAIAAARAVAPLTDPGSALVAVTPEGPVLQEYPTNPPAHVLNGWIFALWGLYDLAVSPAIDAPWRPGPDGLQGDAGTSFRAGVAALAQRLPLYGIDGRWSRYDLYPHPRVNVASPFYHRLHSRLLLAMDRLAPHQVFRLTARRWAAGAGDPIVVARAVARKIEFRRRVRRRWWV